MADLVPGSNEETASPPEQRATQAAPDPLPPDLPFDRSRAPLVASFTCVKPGNQERPWEADARIWITARPGEGGAIDVVEVDGSDVWLYLADTGKVIGFASLGLHFSEAGKPPDGQIIPHIAVSGDFRGQGYGPRIFRWVVDEARRRHLEDRAPVRLLLEVDPDNQGARRMYIEFGFCDIAVDTTDPRQWIIMSYDLIEKAEMK